MEFRLTNYKESSSFSLLPSDIVLDLVVSTDVRTIILSRFRPSMLGLSLTGLGGCYLVACTIRMSSSDVL